MTEFADEPVFKQELSDEVAIMDSGDNDPDLSALINSLNDELDPMVNGNQNSGHMSSMLSLGNTGFPLDNGIDKPSAIPNTTPGSIYNGVAAVGFPSLPDVVQSVSSHEGLDRLMSMVQQQSDALQATSHNIQNKAQNQSMEMPGVATEAPRGIRLTEAHTMQPRGERAAQSSGTTGGGDRSGGGRGGGNSHPFHIDTNLISAVPVSEQSAELQDLGLTVYNREDIEQGIMAQVDQAIAEEEQGRLKKILNKELKAVNDEMRLTRRELEKSANIEKAIGINPTSINSLRKLEKMKKQKEDKLQHLKKLKAKKKAIERKLEGKDVDLGQEEEELAASDGEVALEEALGLGSQSKETERERMIRQGEMTPFGTVVSSNSTSTPGGSRFSSNSEMTSFEKYLMDQQKKGTTKKKHQSTLKKSHSASEQTNTKPDSKGTSSKKSKLIKSLSSTPLVHIGGGDETPPGTGDQGDKAKRQNAFDARDKRRYRPSERDFSNFRTSKARGFWRLQHNFSGDGRLSDADDFSGDDDRYNDDADYNPHQDMMRDDSDYLSGEDRHTPPATKRKATKRKTQNKRAPGEDSGMRSSSDEEGTPKKKRKEKTYSSVEIVEEQPLKRTKDDGDYDCYKERMRVWKKQRLKRKQEKAEQGDTDSSDSEFENIEVDDGFKVPSKVWDKLYPYQRTCVRWLFELHGQGAGGIVGDEMGLGKTIQIISFLAGLRVSHLPDKGANVIYRGLGPTLIVCPATVMHQWVREFHKWWPPFRVGVLHNSGTYTSSVYQLIDDIASSHGILITSYASVTQNQDALLEYDWHYVILDEGHKIRNPDAQVTLAAKRFRTCHRIILSGSPVQNNLKELWSLFDFVFPGKLGTLPDFMAHFSVPIVQGGYSTASQVQVQTAYKCACVLRDTINPYLLRRMKSDVKHNLDLPDKNEQVLFCRLTDEQRDVYREYLDSKECNMILKGDFMVFPGLITLRKICNHPDLTTGGPAADFDLAYREYAEGEKEYGFWRRSGKMIVIRSLLELWHKQGHRVLLFTQSKQMLTILEAFVQSEGYTYLKMDGGTTVAARQPLINKFNQNTSYFVFLLTTRVGGLGVNLTGANRIIIYDPDWNPSTDTQARERAWRIGQQKQVTIYRLMTAGTIEEKIYHRQIFKQFLTNRVLKDPKQRRLFKANDLYELFSLGDPEPSGTTETSAIFAGTGSDVRVKLKKEAKVKDNDKLKPSGQTGDEKAGKKAQNRFDVLREQRDKEKEGAVEEEDEDCVVLASQFTPSNKGKGKNTRRKESPKTKMSANKTEKLGTTNNDAVDNDSDDQVDKRTQKMRELAKKLSQQMGGKQGAADVSTKGTTSSSQETSLSQDMAASHRKHKKHKHKNKHSEREKDKDRKRHKKKKKKDAVFEGERIENLSKLETFQTANEADEAAAKNADQDSYVLARLLNKSGVHSALQHDKIMMSADPDYALVEGEAERVAKEAAKALRRSRQQCPSARSGVPTWTGQSSTAPPPQPAKPRFGLKKNSKLVPNVPGSKPNSSKISATSTEKKASSTTATELPPPSAGTSSSQRHFDGTLAGNVNTNTGNSSNGVMTSSQLLAKMKARNSLSFHDDSDQSQQGRDSMAGLSSVDLELITDIRNFIAFQSHVNGQASTQEILDYFKSRVPKGSSPMFKAMLRQVCDLHKRDDVGMWILKPEFR